MTEDERTELEIERFQQRSVQRHFELNGGSATASLEFCEACGNEIPAARRTALPGVTLCIDCKRAEEKQARSG